MNKKPSKYKQAADWLVTWLYELLQMSGESKHLTTLVDAMQKAENMNHYMAENGESIKKTVQHFEDKYPPNLYFRIWDDPICGKDGGLTPNQLKELIKIFEEK